LSIKLGVKVTESVFHTVVKDLQDKLVDGELIQFMGLTNNLRPLMKYLFVTNERIIGVFHPDKNIIKKEIPHSKIKAAGLGTGLLDNKSLIVETIDNEQNNFGTIKKEDAEFVINLLKQLHGSQSSPNYDELRLEKTKLAVRKQAEISIIGRKPNQKSMQIILDHCHENETPRFIISTGLGTGVFVAFEDRCMIIKVGSITSFMAGSLFGGRVSTFHYGEITGIEYNSGWINGVLEVLTASYDGNKNKDFWKGTLKSRNADSNDPWTLSNCLPLDRNTYNLAQNSLNDLRKLISDSKKPQVIINNLQNTTVDLSAQIKELASLHTKGILSDQEFSDAKAKLISG
jgi:hypothetical protein